MPRADSFIDWEQVSVLLSEALELPESERNSWIDRQPAISSVMAAEVKSLVQAHQHSHELSERAVRSRAEVVEQPDHASSVRVGPYETLRVLGRGGMGVVYLARRADGEFDQTVALKLISAAFTGPDFVSRFKTERQLLAGLTHPNITRLLDGGVTPQGDPYLVMEYIDGSPLDRYCDAACLRIPARLGLFLQLCKAVDFAHRNLILHRDLKPSNVLVTGDGAVKLLDFGTAALIPEIEAQQVTRARLLTPRYASPARLRGERSSVCDDVFSLGVILYELLTGAWPFGDPDSLLGEFKRATADAPAAPPAARATSQAASCRGVPLSTLSRELAGDLSAIVLKALENDPALRYATPAALAADIDRYLHGHPVEARPQTPLYRAAKFLRRRWLEVSAAALVLVAISGSAVLAARSAQAARAEARKTAEVNRFLNGMLSAASQTNFDPSRYTVAQMLDEASAQLEKHPPADPRTAAVLHLSLARSYVPMARFDRVAQHVDLALPVFRAVNDKTDAAGALAVRAYAETYQGSYDAAVAHYREALELLAQLGQQAPAEQVFETKSSYAEVLTLILNRGLAEVQPVYDDLFSLGARDPAIPRTLLAQAMSNWGLELANAGRSHEAEAVLKNALATGRKENPGGMWEAVPLLRLSWLYSKRQDWKRGAEVSARMRDIAARNVGPGSVDTANATLIWARNEVMIGDREEAVRAARAAMPIIEKAAPAPSLTYWAAARNLALVLQEAGFCDEGERYARAALAVTETIHLPAGDSRPAESWQLLGQLLVCRGEKPEALAAFRQAAQIYRNAGPLWSGQLAEVRSAAESLSGAR